jgi:hypothetical protein
VPEDLVPAVLFLASEGSRFMTGQTVNVDGGCVHVEAHRARKHAIELNQSFEGRCRRDITLATGHLISFRLPGAGGYGDQRQRERSLVAEDLQDEKISRESARRDYGCEPACPVFRSPRGPRLRRRRANRSDFAAGLIRLFPYSPSRCHMVETSPAWFMVILQEF